MRCGVLALAACFLVPYARAQVDEIVAAKLDRHTIGALVTRLEQAKAFKHGIAIFPGHPGILKLREENGQPEYDQRGNFLVRSRRHWLDDETLDGGAGCAFRPVGDVHQDFRATPRYGTDIAAILNEVSKRYGVGEWTFVGTSEGSISAFHAARMNPRSAKRVILTSSVFSAGANGPGLTGANFGELSTPLLWVHHRDDPCQFTQYRDASATPRKA
jgi:hypothetical protein